MIIPYILFFIGFILLIKGGDLFVEAATCFARITGLPEVVIGATIVSLATTLPELMFSAISAIHHETAMSLGNAVGSIICNTGFILAICNLIKPSKITSRFFYLKGVLLLMYLIILWVLGAKGVIGHFSSIALFSMLIIYILLNLEIVRYKIGNSKNTKDEKEGRSLSFKKIVLQIFQFFFGALLILVGAHLLVDYGVIIAEYWSVPPGIISLTIIALGTSLPELITSISSLKKDHAELALGNILGANILNITLTIGVSANFNDLIVNPQSVYLDIPMAFLINFLLIIPAFFSKKITRSQAFILLLVYLLYTSFLFIYHV